jgi:hypothetical protein
VAADKVAAQDTADVTTNETGSAEDQVVVTNREMNRVILTKQ